MTILTRVLNDKRAGWEKKLLALMGLVRMANRESLALLARYRSQADPELARCAQLAYEQALAYAQAGGGHDRYGG
jgi:hypothetical protein